MTKKDFELIADVFKYTQAANPSMTKCLWHTAKNMATELASTNPRFNRERFLAACGVLS